VRVFSTSSCNASIAQQNSAKTCEVVIISPGPASDDKKTDNSKSGVEESEDDEELWLVKDI